MKQRSLRDYLLLSWLIPLGFAVAGSAILSIGISYVDFSNYRQSVERKLHQDGSLIARRIAAELLLKGNGRSSAVLKLLQTEYSLSSISLSANDRHTVASESTDVRAAELIPGVSPETFVLLSVPGKDLGAFINFRNFLFALIPIFGLVFVGFLLQRRFTHQFILRPIRALAETSVGNRLPNQDWPVEIQKISKELADSFSNREQAVFGHLARGIIHDLRTYLNSIHTAVQLVDSTQPNTDKRSSMLEKLASACSRNVPKIQEVVDLSLDSSREVTVNLNSNDLAQTLRSSIGNVASIAEAKKVTLTSDVIEAVAVAHDRLQMERVLTNLIKNAIEATDDSPRSQREVHISVAGTEARGITLDIEDSGPGLKTMDSVFRPLKTTKRHGYGLGLFVSKKIMDAHRGQIITGRSERLGGARFTVVLPGKEAGV